AWYWLIVTRIALLPLIAGLAYELIRFAGKHTGNRVLMTLLAPGLWLQRLTTREPTLEQIEVSIRALQEVLRLEGAAATDVRDDDARIDVTANVVMDEVSGKGHLVVESQLHVSARANVDQGAFRRAVEAADEGCPFSQLIKAGAKVSINAELEA